MTILILSIIGIAEETKTYEVEFEPVIIIGKKNPKDIKKELQPSCFFSCILLRTNFHDRFLDNNK